MQGVEHRFTGLVAKRLKVTAGKMRSRVRRVNGFGTHLGHAHPVTGARHGQLGVDRIALAIGIFFIQQRSGNGIRQTIDRAVKGIVFDFKIEGGAIRRGTGIMAAAVHFQKFGEAVRLRIILRAHQRHVLQKMRQPLMIDGILQRPHGHHQRRQGFHRLRIGNQQDHHAIIQANGLILSGIFFAFTNGFLNRLPSGICLT